LATIFDYAFDLPARSLTVAALLALRVWPGAAHWPLFWLQLAALSLSDE